MSVITVYRGQKSWSHHMDVSASSLRRSSGISDLALWTDMLLTKFVYLVTATEQGDQSARQQLEAEILHAQQVASNNPFVSCSHDWGIAQSFALHGNTPGYVLTITGESTAGVDLDDLRMRHRLYGDAVDALREFGIPRRVEPPFSIDHVDLVAGFGQPTTRVFP